MGKDPSSTFRHRLNRDEKIEWNDSFQSVNEKNLFRCFSSWRNKNWKENITIADFERERKGRLEEVDAGGKKDAVQSEFLPDICRDGSTNGWMEIDLGNRADVGIDESVDIRGDESIW